MGVTRDRELPRDRSSATFVMGGCSCYKQTRVIKGALRKNVEQICQNADDDDFVSKTVTIVKLNARPLLVNRL